MFDTRGIEIKTIHTVLHGLLYLFLCGHKIVLLRLIHVVAPLPLSLFYDITA